MECPDDTYRLQSFQLGRLHHALAQRDYATSKQIRFLVDTCIASLYMSCIDAGVGEQARILIETYRRPIATRS